VVASPATTLAPAPVATVVPSGNNNNNGNESSAQDSAPAGINNGKNSAQEVPSVQTSVDTSNVIAGAAPTPTDVLSKVQQLGASGSATPTALPDSTPAEATGDLTTSSFSLTETLTSSFTSISTSTTVSDGKTSTTMITITGVTPVTTVIPTSTVVPVSSKSSGGKSVAPIIGGIIGGVVVMLALVAAAFLLLKRRKKALRAREDDLFARSAYPSPPALPPIADDVYAPATVDLEGQHQFVPVSVPQMTQVPLPLVRAPSPAESVASNASAGRVKRVPVPPLVDFSSNPFSDQADIGTLVENHNPFEDPKSELAKSSTEPSRLSKAESLMPPELRLGPTSRLSSASSLSGGYAPSEPAELIGCAM